MVKIRLMRVGMKGAPSYRVVIADSRSPRDGRIVETIGWYNPLTDPSTIEIDQEKARHWLSVGAQPTDATHALFVRIGLIPSNKAAAKAAKAASTAAAADGAAKAPTAAKAATTAKKSSDTKGEAKKAADGKSTRSKATAKS
ncbi:MAG TPA: 30S ribosomal protein S16 [Ktedonobacterales bacterium]|jgi:small subunit ribosomal protein S16